MHKKSLSLTARLFAQSLLFEKDLDLGILRQLVRARLHRVVIVNTGTSQTAGYSGLV